MGIRLLHVQVRAGQRGAWRPRPGEWRMELCQGKTVLKGLFLLCRPDLAIAGSLLPEPQGRVSDLLPLQFQDPVNCWVHILRTK